MAIKLDMTKAQEMSPMEPGGPYLIRLAVMSLGTSKAGSQKVHTEWDVVEPERYANRKLFEDMSLENEYTLGRFKGMMAALGESEENLEKPDFDFDPDNYIGRKAGCRVKIQQSDQYGPQARIAAYMHESAIAGGV